MLSVLYITVFLISTILLHEYAHYKTGMMLGIKPVDVGFGFGPTLYQKELKDYTFKIKLLPLGGYVSYGKSMFEEPIFYEAPPWKRFLITVAGPLSNMLYAFVLLLGLQLYYTHIGGGLDLLGAVNSFIEAGKDTLVTGTEIAQSTTEYFSGQSLTVKEIASNIKGPIGTYAILKVYTKTPEYTVLMFAIVNMALAMFNLFPFPALDGYTAVTSLIEMVTKRRFNTKVMKWTNIIGFLVVMGLSVILLFWDIIYKLLWL